MKIACLILAGGRGSRLRPLTYFLHKALIPLERNVRAIDYALSSCMRSQVGRDRAIFVLANYKAKQLSRYLKDFERVVVLTETKVRGTGGAIVQNWTTIQQSVPDVVLMMPSDHYISFVLDEIVDSFRCQDVELMLIGAKRNEPSHDYLEVHGNRTVGFFDDKEINHSIAFTGISLVRFDVLDRYIQCSRFPDQVDLTTNIIRPLLAQHVSGYFLLEKPWEDLGTWYRYIKTLINTNLSKIKEKRP